MVHQRTCGGRLSGHPRSHCPTLAPAVVAVLAAALVALETGCRREAGIAGYQGYMEGEYVYVASPFGGALEKLAVSRGDPVQPGNPLFSLDPEPEAQALEQATDELKRAQAQLADAKKGQRPTEIAALEAQLRSTRVDLELAEKLRQRRENLASGDNRVIAVEELDQSRSQAASLQAQVARLTAELETARLGAREDQVRAAEAAVEAAQATAGRARWTVSQKSQASAVRGVVHDTLYRIGEWVAPGSPVVVVLPPENVKARFFVPEAEYSRAQVGKSVQIRYDQAPAPLTATISYVSTRPEFTPPVIYSQQTRSKLVYLVEARVPTNAAATLHPGQPIEVTFNP